MRTATITIRDQGAPRASAHLGAVPDARRRETVVELPLTVRRVTPADEAAVARLAALDSAPVPPGPLLLAESNGELRAALSLTDGRVIADPFQHTAVIVDLLTAVAK